MAIFIVKSPIEHGDFHSFASLPEGISCYSPAPMIPWPFVFVFFPKDAAVPWVSPIVTDRMETCFPSGYFTAQLPAASVGPLQLLKLGVIGDKRSRKCCFNMSICEDDTV